MSLLVERQSGSPRYFELDVPIGPPPAWDRNPRQKEATLGEQQQRLVCIWEHSSVMTEHFEQPQALLNAAVAMRNKHLVAVILTTSYECPPNLQHPA